MKKVAFILAILIISLSLFGCKNDENKLSDNGMTGVTQPQEVDLYAQFRETDIFDASLYQGGFILQMLRVSAQRSRFVQNGKPH